ncbi:MAG: penicillin-binding protein 2 [Actinomycetota bacterium]
MNARLRRLGIGLLVLFTLLFGQIAYVQVFAADSISQNPANATRQYIAEYRIQRGAILAADGTAIAVSERTKGSSIFKYQRLYPQGDLFGSITGYYSRVYGTSELEHSMSPYLSGSDGSLVGATLTDLVLGRPRKGGNVVTTLQPSLQRLAQTALGNQQGAVVAIDPTNGDILAMYSNPSYDPSPLSDPRSAIQTKAWNKLTNDPSQPLLPRANAELFPPGSTFKIITAAAALSAGYSQQSIWPSPHSLQLPGSTATIQNFGGEYCAGGASHVTLLEAFTESCNVIFGEVGLKVGADRLSAQAQAFGFCSIEPPTQVSCPQNPIPFSDPPFGLTSEAGRFPVSSYFATRQPALAISAIGQDNDLANPLQMALVSGAVANNGLLMQPRLVSEIRDSTGRVVQRFPTKAHGQAVTPQVASSLTEMMRNVVANGTGTYAQIPGIPVAGKTGTAQHGTSANPHAWFTGFASANGRNIAVAVIVLDGGNLGSEATGGHVAAPIAQQIIKAWLEGGA